MTLPIRIIILICLLSCTAREQVGHVVKVVDGDTFDLLAGEEKMRVRLFGIDAPERGQAFNVRAKEFTAGLIADKEVRVVIRNKDRYGRFVCDVYLADGRYLNAEIVRAGYAWHFTRYSNDKQLAELQVEARENKRGLWLDKNPIPPWDFRRH
jgi:endonuclease YncB( thermonuclease family)